MAHSVTISVDIDRWAAKGSAVAQQVNRALGGRFDRLFSHTALTDINASYAEALRYGLLDQLAIKVLWLHGAMLALILMLNTYVRLPDLFPSPLGWYSLTVPEGVMALLSGGIALLIPLLAQSRIKNHFVWRILLALSLLAFSYLFVFASSGALIMHFHVFLVMAFMAAYADWRLAWILFGVVSVVNILLDALFPVWLYSYGHNDLSVPLHTLFLLAMTYFVVVLCNNHRDSIVELIAAKRRNEQFLAIASHELRTPLTSMKGYTEVLERRLKRGTQKDLVQFTEKLDDQLNKLSGLIRDLLDMTKIQSGQLVIRRERISINGVVERSIEDVQAIAHHHKVRVSGWCNTAVIGDQVRLEQVMANLLANAIKYSPTSDRVLIRVSEGRDKVVVSVQDFGIGIAKREQENLFKPYSRLQSASRADVPGGLGLGLYICAEIISWHGGKIWLESEENKGSTFSFSLPLIKARPEQPSAIVHRGSYV